MIPDLKLARKIEGSLDIKLLEKNLETLTDEMDESKVKRATIGDIATIKRNK
jgi:putative transcription factor